jgi:hypothetical protein
MSDGSQYEGQWKDAKFNGQGTYTWPNGMKYVGQLSDDKRNGQGILTWPDGMKYVGQFINDQRNGQGTQSWADGDKYVGQYKDGQFNGQGTYTWSDGRQFVGQWTDDKRNGQGVLYNPNGSIKQQGIWRNGEFVQSQTSQIQPPKIVPVVPKPPGNNAQDIKRQKCINLGLAPGSIDFQQCVK